MPQGTPAAVTSAAVRRAEVGAERLRSALFEETGRDYFRHVFASVGFVSRVRAGRLLGSGTGGASANLGGVTIELAPAQERSFTSEQLGNRWRELTGPIPEAVEVDYQVSAMSPGNDVDVMLVGPDTEQRRAAADDVKAQLGGYAGLYSITDSFRAGKAELKLGIKPEAEALGLTLRDLGSQVR